jgi:MFS family permease
VLERLRYGEPEKRRSRVATSLVLASGLITWYGSAIVVIARTQDSMTSPATTGESADERWLAIAAAIVLVLSAVPRLWAAWFDQGIFWPDEIYQSLEQGHRLAFGYGTKPWEFVRGARSWVFPGLLAGLLRVGALFGLDSGRSLVLFAKTTMALISVAGVYLSMRLARSFAGRFAALIAGLFSGFFSAGILIGSRCLAETVSGPLLIAVVLLAMRSGPRVQIAAGALAGLSIYLRYQSGLIAVGVLAITLSERRIRDAMYYGVAAGVVGVLGGLLDWFTWGMPFHAFKMYLWFNLFKSADKFGAYPFGYYADVAWTISGPALLVIVVGLIFSARLAPRLLALVAGYVLIHCVVPHKEFRFLMPIMPIALALSAAGLVDALRRVRAGMTSAVLLAIGSAAFMGFQATQLTWEKIGFPSDRGARSPWHSGEGLNRLLWSLGPKDDLCGVMVTGESFGWTGGYSYLHRDVNMFAGTSEPERAAANYLIALATEPAPDGYRKVGAEREFVLHRRDGGCAPPPAGYKRVIPY